VDEIRVTQVLPRRRLVKVARRIGEGSHPLHRDARRVERVRKGRGIAADPSFHLSHHAVHVRKVGAHAHGELGIAERLREPGTQGAVGHLEAGGAASHDFQAEVEQHLERQARV
jgi:hypothetical protein